MKIKVYREKSHTIRELLAFPVLTLMVIGIWFWSAIAETVNDGKWESPEIDYCD